MEAPAPLEPDRPTTPEHRSITRKKPQALIPRKEPLFEVGKSLWKKNSVGVFDILVTVDKVINEGNHNTYIVVDSSGVKWEHPVGEKDLRPA
ncbi:hypothetical protein EPUS_05416 [Endocarpon pusillum Z07020]|uniref:Uncharacterized protein n=1 Tax=Endocarpon pusillum (strain Z07020 / HMAS-L-300199) TaxID=1263415 RepID=U1HLI6_ENDPU|nr:uncharacterized protein EPUS_05416 [Endocarpon pusillum Z07020]ERF69874.1 hypothetical protein EPUS_05416 [Endocarpon pusillum Z07020]